MAYSLKLLYSGSEGNAALLTGGETSVLIDAGRSCRALTAALLKAGSAPERLAAIFLTHEHRDHTAALEVFLSHHPMPVYVAGASAERLLSRGGEALRACAVPMPPLFTVSVGELTLSSFPTSHDSAYSVGYRIAISAEDGVRFVGYATDLGVVTPAVEEGLLGCEAVVIEANHDEEMLMTGPYPAELKRRIASRHGHLSNSDCAVLAARLAAAGTSRFLLAHLSEINNTPDLALGEVCAALADTAHCVAASPTEITEI